MGNTVKENPASYPRSNGNPVLTLSEWEALKLASIRGVPDRQLVEQFGVKLNTICKRRSRDPLWLAACANRITNNKRPRSSQVVKSTLSKEAGDSVKLAVTNSLDAIAAENPVIIANAMHEMIKRSLEGNVIPDPQTLQELAIANKLLRTSTGQDKAEGTVTLNLWSGRDLGDTFAGGVRDVSEAS